LIRQQHGIIINHDILAFLRDFCPQMFTSITGQYRRCIDNTAI